MSKYIKGQKLINKSEGELYQSFGDVIIIGKSSEGNNFYDVECLGDSKEDFFNESELDYHFKIEETKMNIEENKHHLLWKGMQSLDVMKSALTRTEYIGFLKGQILKYQLRLGKKDDVAKELKKIQDYTNELNKMLDEERN